MRTTFLAAVLMLTAVPAGRAFAQTKDVVATTRLTTQVWSLELQRIQAMVNKDIATLDALLADDLSYTHSGGTTDTKASFIKLIKERGRYLGIDYSKTEIIPWGDNTVVIRGVAQIRLENTPAYSVLFMDVWALRGGAWKMAAWQATRVQNERPIQ